MSSAGQIGSPQDHHQCSTSPLSGMHRITSASIPAFVTPAWTRVGDSCSATRPFSPHAFTRRRHRIWTSSNALSGIVPPAAFRWRPPRLAASDYSVQRYGPRFGLLDSCPDELEFLRKKLESDKWVIW